MEIELHVTVPGHGRAVLTGRGKDALHLRFTVRGTTGATAWVTDLLRVPHSGYCPDMGGPWAGRIGGRLPILVMALVDKQRFNECTVAFIKMPSEEETGPGPEYDELTPPPWLVEQVKKVREERHPRAKPMPPPKRPTSPARRP